MAILDADILVFVAKRYILQQQCLKKWIGSALGTWWYNFQPPTLTLSATIHVHVRSPKHSQGSAIEVLGSPDHGCGTVCPLNCDSKTFASPSLGGYLRHFCSLRLGTLWLLCFNGAGYKHSYLLFTDSDTQTDSSIMPRARSLCTQQYDRLKCT